MHAIRSVCILSGPYLCVREDFVSLRHCLTFTPLAPPVCVVLTRRASLSSVGQNDFPDLLILACPSICCCLSLLPTCRPPPPPVSAPPPTHPPTHVPFPSLYSAGGPARRQCTRLRSVIYSFSPSHFHFNPLFTAGTEALCMQMSASCLFFFSSAHSEKRGGGRGRKRVEPDGRVKVCGAWRQQLSAEIIHFHLIGIQPTQQEDSRCFFCRLITFQM